MDRIVQWCVERDQRWGVVRMLEETNARATRRLDA